MATYEELMAELRKADAAGDVESAKVLAQRARAAKAAPVSLPASAPAPADLPTPAIPVDAPSPAGFTDQIAAMMIPNAQTLPVQPLTLGGAPGMMGGVGPDAMTAAIADAARKAEDERAMVAAPSAVPPLESDPFAGEGLAALFKRRGQQFAAGATEVIASVPEAMAIAGAQADQSRAAGAAGTADLRAAMIGDMETALADKSLPADQRAIIERNIADLMVGQGVLSGIASEPIVPARDRESFKAGDKAREAVKSVVGAPDPRDAGFWSQVAQGGGNMVGMIGTSLAGGVIGGPVGALAAGAASGSTLNSSSLYKEAIESGADEEAAQSAARWGALIGASEIVPITRALKILPPRLRGELTTGMMRKFVDIAQSAGEEAAQEYLATVANNITAQQLFDPNRGWTEGATDAAIVGAVLGGGVGAVGSAMDDRGATRPPRERDEPTTPPAPTIIDQIAAAMQPPAQIAPPVAPQPEQTQPVMPQAAPVIDADQSGAAVRPSAPPAPQPDPQEQIAAAMTGQPPAQPAAQPTPAPRNGQSITRAEAEANPDRYEIIDEAEGQGANMRPTGRQVVIDNQTGQAFPLAPEAVAVAPAATGAPGGENGAGKPQDAPDAKAGGEPAAGPAPQADVVDAGGGVTPPAPVKNQPRNFEFIDAQGVQGIGTEPEVMQYKAGGDADGVTDRLRGVTEWRPERAGVSIIYEYADGRRVIADGHQRLGLAKRLSAQGKPIQMPAMILRQADGVSPKEARATAALKNIAEGSGTALDAAKVLRDTEQTPDQLGLPPASAIVRDAMGLRSLSDQAFGMVVNGVSTERDGGIVGRVVTDKTAQANILALLARVQKDRPITAFQAEQVARQAAADTVTETQDSLFGPESDTKNLYLERAKILEAANRMARDEKHAFKNVLDNADRLEAAGNQLDAEGNKARVDNATKISEYLAREANTKGAISEALTAAARALNGGATLAAATRQFRDAVERELGARGAERPSGDQGSRPPAGQRQEEPADQGLDTDARDDGAADGDLFGAKPAPSNPQADILSAMTGQTQPALAIDSPQIGKTPDQLRAEAEAKTKADQSKIRKTGGNDGDAGPLFNPDQDLFDQPKKAESDGAAAPRAPQSGAELIQQGRGILQTYSAADDPGEIVGNDDLSQAAEGLALADALLKAKDMPAKKKVAADWVLKNGKRTGKEHLVVLGKDGVPLAIMRGAKNNVSALPSVFRAGFDGAVTFSAHNHPSSTSLSGGDLAMAVLWKGHTMMVVPHNGTLAHEIRFADAVDIDPDVRGRLQGTTGGGAVFSAIAEGFTDARSGVISLLNRQANAIGRNDNDGGAARFHRAERAMFQLVLAKAGIINYTDAKAHREAVDAEGINFEDIYGQISGNVVDRLRRAGLNIPETGDSGGNRPADGGPNAASPGTDGADQQPSQDAGQGDGKTRLPRKPVKPTTGNAAIDGALDDIFGDDTDVSGTSNDMERGGRDGAAADGMGGTDVPASTGGSGRGTGGGRKAAGGAKRKPRAGSGVSDRDAASVGKQGDQAADGSGRPGGQPAASGDGGRRNGGGDGGLPSVRAGKSNAAGDASGPTRKLTPAEQLAALRNVLKEDAISWVSSPSAQLFLREDPATGLDPRAAETIYSIIANGESLAGVNVAQATDRQLFAQIMLPLKDAGMTRAEVAQLAPYLESFLRDLRAGRINLTPDADTSQKPIEADDRAAIQAEADKVRVKPVDRDNIDKTLPLLLPEQRDDVFKVETRFAKPDGHGMMITNGTGTGKTFSGGGVIKRFVQQGKNNVLIIAPSDAVIAGWKGALTALGVPSSQLESTKDAGQGVVITTYANLMKNDALATRKWDLVVTDEAQNLMSSADAAVTGALRNLRAITNRPDDLAHKSDMIHAEDWARYKKMPKGDAKDATYRRLAERREREVQAMRAEPRSKVLFLSATPFAYDKTVDYAEGYLFSYPEDGMIGNSRQPGRNLFMVKNFGYRIRYHKLTKPEHAVDSAVFEREFHEQLKRDGVLSGRSLQVDVDYDRKFVKKDDADGTRLDEALDLLDDLARQEREAHSAAVKAGQIGTRPDRPFSALQGHMRKNFDYLARQQLLEAIKARLAVEEIRAHLALGRKVVVFHDFNVGGGLNPFTHLKTQAVGIDPETGEEIRMPVSPMTAEASEGYRKLIEAHPWIKELNFAGYKPPIEHLPQALGKTVRLFNGKVPTKTRLENLAAFNTDGSGVDVLVVQADAGGAGISMHDVTKGHQRALINLGMPTKPTTTLQQEGRILRVGSKSDAIFRYFTIGTGWERTAFAQRIAERSGTVENLALGEQARDMMNAFIDAYMDASDFAPTAQDGKGGKAKDARSHNVTPYQRAVSHYFGRPKISGKRDQRDGIDFYPTAEPLAYKMVQWAGLRANERVLEPSAGDGAIARYMPDDVALTLVEPSSDLRSTAQLRAPKADARETTFEQHHISNKYHAIVMNPPFGAGGATAMQHLAKAAKHLRAGGRIVALIPTGPSADKKFDAWWHSDDAAEFNFTAEISLPPAAFERAGTSVMTRIVVLDRIPDQSERGKFGAANGGPKRLNFAGAQNITDFFDRLEGYDIPRRPEPKQDVVAELEAEGEDATTPVRAGVTVTAPLALDASSFVMGTYTAKSGNVFFTVKHPSRVSLETLKTMDAIADQFPRSWRQKFGVKRDEGPTYAFKSEADRAAFIADVQKPISGMEESPQSMFREDQVAFYSPLLRAIEGAKQAKAAPKDWKAILPKLAGVKKAELDWLGIDEWLSVQDTQGVRQVERNALADFVRQQQIQITIDVHGDIERLPSEPYDDTPEWRDPTEDDAERMIDSDDDWESPDYVISEGDPIYPDDWEDEAEMYLDEARDELAEEAQEYWDEEDDGEFDPDSIPSDAILDRAKQIAEDRFEPSQYDVTLYDRTGNWPEYSGYWDSDNRTYFFGDLDQDDLDGREAIRAAERVYEAAREKAIQEKFAQLLDEGLSAEGLTREDFEAEVAREQELYRQRMEEYRERNAEVIARNEARGLTGEAAWGSYTEKGGADYREILIRVPDLHASGPNKQGWEVGPDGIGRESRRGKSPFVQTSHFKKENIVVHARVKDRVDRDGKRVLFIEEIQSDLATKWREVKEDTPEVAAKRAELERQWHSARDARAKAGQEMAAIILAKASSALWGGTSQHAGNASSMAPELAFVLMGKRNLSGAMESTKKAFTILEGDMQAMGAAKRYDDAHDALMRVQEDQVRLGTERKADPTLATSPWADPEQYVLMVKYLLREAAAKGYDKLSWTPGWMQARRWNKAVQSVVEGVDWETGSDGGKRITLHMMGGRGIKSVRTDDQGTILSVDTDMGAQGVGEPLARMLGGDVAKQVMADESGKVSGQTITFGSSGYAIAYDGHIKRAVEKLVKPLGGKVVEDRSIPEFRNEPNRDMNGMARSGRISGADASARLLAAGLSPDMPVARQIAITNSWDDRKALTEDQAQVLIALRTADSAGKAYIFEDVFPSLTGERQAVWSVELTPEARTAANVPQPMFQRKRRQMVREAAAATEAIRSIMPALRAELDRLDLKRVKLSAREGETGWQGAFVVTGDGEMEIVIGASLDPIKTLHHEVIHALRAMNLFTSSEWRALSLAAEQSWLAKHDIEARYPNLSREQQIEEAIAEEFSEALAARKAPKGSALVVAFNKIARIFRAIRNVLNGAGYQTPEDVFGAVLAGEISKRQAGNTGAMAAFQRRNAASEGQGDLFAQPAPTPASGMTADQRRELEARQKQSKIRKAGGNSGDAGPLFNDDRDLFGDRMMFQRPPLAVRPLTPQGRAHRNSALGANPFIPDRRIWETLTQAGVPIWQRLRDLPGAASDAVDRARFVIQDRMLPVLRAQEAVMRDIGRHLPKEHDAYIAETTFSGKVGRHLLEVDEEFTKPIIQIIAASNGRMDADSVGEWLYARHAVERNAYIASINPMMPDGGSGMLDAEAQQILAAASASPDVASYDRIGALIDQLRERNLKLREDAGLISNTEANLWRTQYKHYVPLKGFEETDNHASMMDLRGVATGRRFSIRGAETRRALGRGSEAFNPLQSAITQAQEVAIRAEKNRVAQALYGLAENYPSKALWEVKKPKQKRYFNRTTGLVETRVEDPVSMVLEPNEMAVKIDGQEHRILFNDQRLAEAAGTLGADQMSSVVRILSIFSRFFSMTRTMLNPEFMVTNALRDFQTAQFNIQAFGEADKARIAKAMAKNWRKAFMGAMRGSTYRFDTEWSKYYKEFQKAGAQVWFWTMEQPEAARGDLERRIELARGNKARRALKVMTTPSAFFSFRDNAVLSFIERTNLAVDNAIRLAAFVEARKAGWDVEKAAFLAKELTVNFNRRGEAGANMNALYPFFNAAIQGTVRTVKAISSRRVALMVLTAFAAGALNDMINAALSDEDKDGELLYDKVANFRNERNFHMVLWGTGESPFAIPMPYGYNVFPYAGQQLGKVMRGVKAPEDAFRDVASAIFGAYSPISASTPAQMISPFYVDPIVEMAENKNWVGVPIYPRDHGNQSKPDAYVHFSGATAVSKWVAQALNELTGGDFRESGAIDVSPETLDHLASFTVGSAGAFWGRSADILGKALALDFDGIESREVPFYKIMRSPIGDWADRDRYYRFGDEVRNAQADKNAYEAAGLAVPKRTADLASLHDDYLKANREMNGMGEWRKPKPGAPSKPGALVAREPREVYLDVNGKYLRVMGRQGE